MNLTEYHLDMKDPLIITWILRKLDRIAKVENAKAIDIQGNLFNDEVIKYLLGNADSELLTSVFHSLRSELFRGNLQMIMQYWPGWRDKLAGRSAQTIAALDPTGAYELFLNENVPGDDDVNKTIGIMESLSSLSKEKAGALAFKFVDWYKETPKNSSLRIFMQLHIVNLAWEYEHPDFETLARDLILSKQDKDRYYNTFSALSSLISGSCTDYNFICDRYYGYTDQAYASLSAFFREHAPLGLIDDAIQKLKTKNYKGIQELYRETRNELNDERKRNFLDSLIHDEDLSKSLDTDIGILVYAFVLGCIVHSLKKETLCLTDLAIEEVVDLLAIDFEEVPFFKTMRSFLSRQDTETVNQCLIRKYHDTPCNLSAKHILDMMGALQRDEFLPCLIHALTVESDWINNAAQDALLRYGDTAECEAAKAFHTMDIHAKMSTLKIMEYTGCNEAIDSIDEFFDELWGENKGYILNVITSVPDERFIRKISNRINKGQYAVDRAYVLLNKLLGKNPPDLREVEEKVLEHDNEARTYRDYAKEGKLLETVKPYMDVELKCLNCGEENIYRVDQIIMSTSGKIPPYIARKLLASIATGLRTFKSPQMERPRSLPNNFAWKY